MLGILNNINPSTEIFSIIPTITYITLKKGTINTHITLPISPPTQSSVTDPNNSPILQVSLNKTWSYSPKTWSKGNLAHSYLVLGHFISVHVLCHTSSNIQPIDTVGICTNQHNLFFVSFLFSLHLCLNHISSCPTSMHLFTSSFSYICMVCKRPVDGKDQIIQYMLR